MYISWVASGNSCADRLCDNSEAAWSSSPSKEKWPALIAIQMERKWKENTCFKKKNKKNNATPAGVPVKTLKPHRAATTFKPGDGF